jgi:hypothetical protein
MSDLTVSNDVDTLLQAADQAGIQAAIGLPADPAALVVNTQAGNASAGQVPFYTGVGSQTAPGSVSVPTIPFTTNILVGDGNGNISDSGVSTLYSGPTVAPTTNLLCGDGHNNAVDSQITSFQLLLIFLSQSCFPDGTWPISASLGGSFTTQNGLVLNITPAS